MLSLQLTAIATERTTAATDALLAVAVVAGITWLHRHAPASLRRTVWLSGLALFALAAVLGAIAHGVELDPRTRELLWQPLFLALGAALALFSAGAIGDWRGDASARRALPFLLAVALGFYLLTRLSGGKFLVFVLFEAAALLFALAVYVGLALRKRTGAGLVVVGLVLSLVGAVLQATSLSLWFIWEFNHNGLYHLVQLIGVIFLITGLRGTLSVPHAGGAS